MELIYSRFILNWSFTIAAIIVVIQMCGGKKKKNATIRKAVSPAKSPKLSDEKSKTPETKTPEKEKEIKKEEGVKEAKEDVRNLSLKPMDPSKYTAKEMAIAAGLKKKRTDYPTIDDAPSDWDDSKKSQKNMKNSKKDGDEQKDETKDVNKDEKKDEQKKED